MSNIVSGIFGGGNKPKPLDPAQVAREQIGVSKEAIKESAKHSQIGQESPFGSSYWTGTIGEPDRTQHTTLAPMDQANLDRIRGINNGLLGLVLSGNVNPVAPELAQAMMPARAEGPAPAAVAPVAAPVTAPTQPRQIGMKGGSATMSPVWLENISRGLGLS